MANIPLDLIKGGKTFSLGLELRVEQKYKNVVHVNLLKELLYEKKTSTFTFPVATQERNACAILPRQHESFNKIGWNEVDPDCSTLHQGGNFSAPLIIRDKSVQLSGSQELPN